MSSVTDFSGQTSVVTTSADGLPTALSLGSSGDTVATTYGANDATASIALNNGSSTLQSFTYSDAPAGNVVSEADTPASSSTPSSYTYDAQSRVTSDTKGTSGTSTYAEDQSGNLTTLPTGASATYNNASELVSSTLAGTATTYAYDASGNMTGQSVGGTQTTYMSYNGANELTYVLNSAATMNDAAYDGNGLRMSSSITPSGGSADVDHYVWNTTGSVPQLLMDSSNAYLYGPSGTPFEQVDLSTGAVTFLVSDALGSVRGAVSASGGLDATATYDAWGNVVGSSGLTTYSAVGFDGALRDETGLTYLVHRYYDPALGQFSSVDPAILMTLSPLAFAGDNVARAIVHYAISTARTDVKSDIPALRLIGTDWNLIQWGMSGGGPPPSGILAQFNDLARNLSVVLVSQFRNLATIATSAYSFADASATLSETYRTAVALSEIADAAVGTAEQNATAIAADTAAGLAYEAAGAKALSFGDLIRAILTFGEGA
ncbi:MAG: hypothetical protein B7X07_07545 [Actinobacteria bacterium 21-64-8]|nr:MAG: hypothetical protein B7X07_07545 [Actinobacteria bacterium 21-64-8]